MAEDHAGSASVEGGAPAHVNLQIVSPSVGVNTMMFPGLETSTTVGQLKEKIRESLPLRPANDHLRLIHRGRLLARDTETLQEIFGDEMLRTNDQQTLHLVVRDLGDHDSRSQTPSRATPVRDLSPAPGNAPPPQPQPQTQQHPHHHHHHHHTHTQHRVHPLRNAPPGMNNPAVQQLMQLQLQREAYRQILIQQQRDRAAMGYNGIQDTGNVLQGQGTTDAGVEGIRRRMTPNEGYSSNNPFPPPGTGPTSNPSQGSLTPAEIQNILRGADTTQATQTITNAMHRSASGASLTNLANFNVPVQPIQPGVTTPHFPSGSRHASRTATPDPLGRPIPSVGGFTAHTSQSQPHAPSTQGQPEVYILSSPTGPRGLLINNNSEMYVTPVMRAPNLPAYSFFPQPLRQPNLAFPQPFPSPLPNPQLQPPHNPGAPPQQMPLPGQPQGQTRQPPPQVQVRLQRPVRPLHAHPNNPGAGALMAAAWPHVWLIIRLVIFVWWFTSSDASWSRWLAMVAIAMVVFIVNTGFFDGAVGRAWNPIRQHLEGLLPLGDANANANANPPQRPQPPPGFPPDPNDRDAPPVPARPDQHREPDPGEAAARLLAMRQHENTTWFMDQLRRVERAGLLFLASIAPGVAERHIAHLEAQERAAERRRRELEEAAVRAAEEAAAAAAAANERAGDEDRQAHNEEQQREQPAPPPLIEI